MKTSNSEKTIVHILCSFNLSGAHIFAINLANEHAKHYNVTLISSNPRFDDAIITNRIDPNVKVIHLKVNRLLKSIAYHIGNSLSGMAQNNPFYVSLMAWIRYRKIKGVCTRAGIDFKIYEFQGKVC